MLIDRPKPPPPPPPKPKKVARKAAAPAAPAPRREGRSSSFQTPRAGPARREGKSTSFQRLKPAPMAMPGPGPAGEPVSMQSPDRADDRAAAAARQSPQEARTAEQVRKAIVESKKVDRTASPDEVKKATDDFKKAKAQVDKDHQALQVITSELKAAGRTPAEIQAAVTKFNARHQKEYERYEQAGAKLAGLVDDATRLLQRPRSTTPVGRFPGLSPRAREDQIAREALAQLPALADTRAGAGVLEAQVNAAAHGQSNFLSDVKTVLGTTRDAKALMDQIATAAVMAVGSRAVDFAKAGNLDQAREDLEGLRKLQGSLFGLSDGLGKDGKPTGIGGLIDKLEQFERLRASGATDAELATFSRSVNGEIKNLSGKIAPGLADAFKGLGLVLGAVGTVSNFADLDHQGWVQRFRTVSDAMSLGVDGASTALKIFKNTESVFLEGAAKKLPLIGAVFDGIDAIKAFSKGNLVDGGASAAMAIGAVMAATGIGAPVGVALMVAGGAVKLVESLFGDSKEGDEFLEGQLKQAYLDAGLPASVATALDVLNHGQRVIGPFLEQMGGNARAFLDKLAAAAKRDPDAIENFRKMVQGLKRDDHGRVVTTEVPPTPISAGRAGGGLYDSDTPAHPKSWPNALAWLRAHHLA